MLQNFDQWSTNSTHLCIALGMMCILLSLPARAFSDALGSRLTIKDLVRLDSAMCQQNIRELWLTSVSAKSFTLQVYISLNNKSVQWLILKRLKVLVIALPGPLDIKFLSEYLRLHGSSVQSVCVRGDNKECAILIVGMYCSQIRTVGCLNLELTSVFADLLWRNENIRAIRLEGVQCRDSSAFKSLRDAFRFGDNRTTISSGLDKSADVLFKLSLHFDARFMFEHAARRNRRLSHK